MLSRASRHLGRSSLLDHKLLGDLPRHCGDEELPSDKAVCLSTVGGSLDTLEKHAGPASKPLSYPLSAAAFLKDHLLKKSLRESGVEVQACRDFDDRFD